MGPPPMRMTDEVAAVLKSYVYVYIDPRDGKPFYIGKGKGGRLFAHLDDRSECREGRPYRRTARARAWSPASTSCDTA